MLQVYDEACVDAYGPTAMDFNSTFLGTSALEGSQSAEEGGKRLAGSRVARTTPQEEAEEEGTLSQPPFNLFCIMSVPRRGEALSQAVRLFPGPSENMPWIL